MVQIGARRLGMRDGGPFRGMTVRALAEYGTRQFSLLQNCYVSSDAQELRLMPGFKCVFDPMTSYGTGYHVTHVDAQRPVTNGGTPYAADATPTEALYVRSDPLHFHAFEFIRGRLAVLGESGFRKEPILWDTGVFVKVSSITAGTTTTVTLDHAPLTHTGGNPCFNRLFTPVVGSNPSTPYPQNMGDVVYIDGLDEDDDLGALLNGRFHKIIAISGADVTIDTDTTSVGVGSLTGQQGNFYKVRIGPAYARVLDYPRTYFGDANSLPDADGASATDDPPALTCWWTTESPNPDAASPISTCNPSYVFNRQRDFGDGIGNPWEGGADVGTNGGRYLPFSRRRQKPLPYRINPHIAGGRIILAAPGYGCTFQVPFLVATDATGEDGYAIGPNDLFDKPRALGVPKATMLVDRDTSQLTSKHVRESTGTTTELSFGGTASASRAGVYKFRVCYRDDATGEIGLPSEEVSIATDAVTYTDAQIHLYIYHPGYLLAESGALSILVFRTERNGSDYYFDSIVRDSGSGPAFNGTVGSTHYSLKYGIGEANDDIHINVIDWSPYYKTDAQLRASATIDMPSIEQMPRGCEDAQTVRGYTVFGGDLGETGEHGEMRRGRATGTYDGPITKFHNVHNQITFKNTQGAIASGIFGGAFSGTTAAELTPTASNDRGTSFGCAQECMPPAYAGFTLVARGLWPFPKKIGTVAKLLNNRVDLYEGDSIGDGLQTTNNNEPRSNYVRYEVTETSVDSAVNGWTATNKDTHLIVPSGTYQISEQGRPGVTPATNTGVLDTERNDSIVAVGSYGGQAVLATKQMCYGISWGLSPIGPTGIVPPSWSAPWGCIAANTMVEFDGGLAWISNRGPVAYMGGAVSHVGADLESYFQGKEARYKKDSRGMMRHAFAVHDKQRQLVLFGLFSNRTDSVVVDYRGTEVDWDAASDEARSRFPCDEILVWSYRTNSWSVWIPKAGMEWQWASARDAQEGDGEVYFMDRQGRIYLLDDLYAEHNRDAIKRTVTSTGTSGAISFSGAAIGQALSDRGSSDSYVEAGMDLLVTSSTGVFKFVAPVSSFTSSSVTPGAATLGTRSWASGDIVYIGVKQATVRTTWLSPKASTEPSTVAQVSLRYYQRDRYQQGAGVAQPCYAAAGAKANKRVTNVDSGAATFCDVDYGRAEKLSDGLSTQIVRDQGLALGRATGQNKQVEMTIVGGGSVALCDLYMDMQ